MSRPIEHVSATRPTYVQPGQLARAYAARKRHNDACSRNRQRAGRLTGNAAQVIGAIFGTAVRTGDLCPSLEEIARRAGCSIDTVERAIAELEALGFMTWVHRFVTLREHGKWVPYRWTNRYILLIPGHVPAPEPDPQIADARPLTDLKIADAGLSEALARLGRRIAGKEDPPP